MAYLKFVFIYSVILGVSFGLQCGEEEVIDECPSNCSYEYCPKNELQSKKPCEKPKVCPEPACKCRFNYRRADNGTCIPTTECPPFPCHGRNEVYDPCPPVCPAQDCSAATPQGRCPFLMLFVLECTPSCRCIKHYWRKNGICVPYEECFD